ncbi:uncharacterized protein LOC134710193 [Mytilus trossulus]|uniref:uncharacterized protein LOC134710193 n=1 Tax=Mytilus trossulus TaxID=6551 RepID=UPI0030054393
MAECLGSTEQNVQVRGNNADTTGNRTINQKRDKKRQIQRPRPTRVVSVKKRSLNHMGFKDLEHWLEDTNNIYIGRDMTHYVPGAVGSKWQNPFKDEKLGKEKRVELYEEYILSDTKTYDGKTLLESIEELQGKTLGCWCKPEFCHGDVLVQILMRSKKSTLN